MTRIGQGIIALLVLLLGLAEAAEKKSFRWKEPRIGAGIFSDALGMLDREREEYATNLAVFAVNEISREQASVASLEQGCRFLALSMHLAPRNKRALVANYQLSRGVIPRPIEGGYSKEVLSRLILTRAELLKGQGGLEDQMLARIFIDLAAELSPRDEDAVYASELQRLDHGRLDWSKITDVKTPNVPPGEASVEDEE